MEQDTPTRAATSHSPTGSSTDKPLPVHTAEGGQRSGGLGDAVKYQPAPWERAVAVGLSVIIVLSTLFLVIQNEPIDPNHAVNLRILLSLGSAIVGATIPGFLHVDWSFRGVSIRAGGALALFVLTFFGSPRVIKIAPPPPPSPPTTVGVVTVGEAGYSGVISEEEASTPVATPQHGFTITACLVNPNPVVLQLRAVRLDARYTPILPGTRLPVQLSPPAVSVGRPNAVADLPAKTGVLDAKQVTCSALPATANQTQIRLLVRAAAAGDYTFTPTLTFHGSGQPVLLELPAQRVFVADAIDAAGSTTAAVFR